MTKSTLLKILLISIVNLSITSILLASSHSYMGVYLSDLSQKEYEEAGLEELYGVEIMKVVNESPAESAGLKKNDIILKLDGEKVYTYDQLTKMLTLFKPEQVIKLDVWRKGDIKDIKLTLGEKKSMKSKKKAYLGVYLRDLKEKDYEEYNIDKGYGIMIENTVEDGPAEKAGIKAEDILIELAGTKVYTSDQLSKMLKSMTIGDVVKVKVLREGKKKDFKVQLGEKEYGFNLFFGDDTWEFFNDPGNVLIYRSADKNGKWIGVRTMEFNKQLKESFDVENGIMIQEVLEDTPADKAGLKAGDIIIRFAGKKIDKGQDLTEVIASKEVDEEVEVELIRDKKPVVLKLKIGERQYGREKKVEVSVEEGDVKVWVDDLEDIYYDVGRTLEGLDNIKGMKHGLVPLPDKGLDTEDLNFFDIDLEIIDNKAAREL